MVLGCHQNIFLQFWENDIISFKNQNHLAFQVNINKNGLFSSYQRAETNIINTAKTSSASK